MSGSCYNTEEVESRQERKETRARASLQALSRGDSGCAMSPVEMARAMAGLLRMHQSEFEMQVGPSLAPELHPAFFVWKPSDQEAPKTKSYRTAVGAQSILLL